MRLLPVATALLLALPIAAQMPLDTLHDEYQQQRMQAFRDGAGPEKQQKLAKEFVGRLETFVNSQAKGLDRFNGRLMLVDYQLSLGQRDRAVKTLKNLDAKAAPGLILLGAAEFAGHIGLADQRNQWIDAAVAKKEPFEDRMAMAAHLMTRLEEVTRGEAIFEQARGSAKSDEDRAKVAWYYALAIREREDLPEGAYDKELKKLAEAFPKTYYGGITVDRIRARDFKIGSDALPLSGPGMDGAPVRLADYEGQVILLDFWASWCGPCHAAAPRFVEWQKKYADQGLQVLGVCMDESAAEAKAVRKELGMDWPQIYDGKGPMTEAALRYAVDMPPRLVLIDRQGKIAALHLYPFDAPAAGEVERAIEAALAGGD